MDRAIDGVGIDAEPPGPGIDGPGPDFRGGGARGGPERRPGWLEVARDPVA